MTTPFELVDSCRRSGEDRARATREGAPRRASPADEGGL